MPTEKSPEVEALLTSMAGISRQQSDALNICTWCKKPITEFRDPLSVKEYSISGFCQECQDATFDGPDDVDGIFGIVRGQDVIFVDEEVDSEFGID